MLVVFSPIFVGVAKIIFGYDFGALMQCVKRYYEDHFRKNVDPRFLILLGYPLKRIFKRF